MTLNLTTYTCQRMKTMYGLDQGTAQILSTAQTVWLFNSKKEAMEYFLQKNTEIALN